MSEIKNPIENLGAVTIIHLDISYSPGFKKLPRKELQRIYGKELPPQEYITQGQGRLYPKQAVQIFDTLRVSARAVCRQAGISFMGGFAIPDNRVAEVLESLQKLQKSFLEEKAAFIRHAGRNSQAWIEQAPAEWQQILRGSTYTSEELDRKLGFEFAFFRMNPVIQNDSKGSASSFGLEKQANGMAGQLLNEISKDALEAWTETLKDKDKCQQRTVDRIRKLCGKLHDLAWLSPRTKALSEQVTSVMEDLPKSGPIEGSHFMAFRGLVLVLADPEKIDVISRAKSSKDKQQDIFAGFQQEDSEQSPVVSNEIVDSEDAASEAPDPLFADFSEESEGDVPPLVVSADDACIEAEESSDVADAEGPAPDSFFTQFQSDDDDGHSLEMASGTDGYGIDAGSPDDLGDEESSEDGRLVRSLFDSDSVVNDADIQEFENDIFGTAERQRSETPQPAVKSVAALKGAADFPVTQSF